MSNNTIRYGELEQFILVLSESRYHVISPNAFVNLLCRKEKNGYGYHEKTFLYRLKRLLGRKQIIDEDVYGLAVMETVRGYASDKSAAIRLFKELDRQLSEEKNISFHVEYPEVDPGSRFERTMFISRYIQDPEADIGRLPDLLWVSERTVDEDLASLRGRNEKPVMVNGRKFRLDDLDRRDNHIISQASTVHPVLLMCNLTEVMVTLRGLKVMAEDPVLKGYAIHTASEIWNQLTEYAKNRIHYVSHDLLGEDTSWLDDLVQTSDNPFHTERACSRGGHNSIMECLKNGMPCWVEYRMEDDCVEIIHADGIVHLDLNDSLTIMKDGEEIKLDMAKIINVTDHGEELY